MRTETFPLDGVDQFELHGRIGAGSFTVRAVEGLTEAVVTIAPRDTGSDVAERTAVELSGSRLAIHTPRPGGLRDLPLLGDFLTGAFGGTRGGPKIDRESVDVTVRIPAGSAVTVGTFTGTITLEGRCGRTDLTTGDGEIGVERVDGDLRLRYGRAACRVEQVTGSVEARAGAGEVRLGDVGGGLRLGAGTGDVEVASVGGPVHARTGSGTIALRAIHADVDLVTGSGTLSVGLPAGRPARLDLTTGFGRVDSQLPVIDTPTSSGQPLTVRARTGSGDITLFRAGTEVGAGNGNDGVTGTTV